MSDKRERVMAALTSEWATSADLSAALDMNPQAVGRELRELHLAGAVERLAETPLRWRKTVRGSRHQPPRPAPAARRIPVRRTARPSSEGRRTFQGGMVLKRIVP